MYMLRKHYIPLLFAVFMALPAEAVVSASDSLSTDSIATEPISVRRARRGIIIVGKGANQRAFEPFNYSMTNAHNFAGVVNRYARAFGDSVKTYLMAIPTQAAYYCPPQAEGWVSDQREATNDMYGALDDSVRRVNIYDSLAVHFAENIYLRTDHHWAPLAAYYAAREFAREAGVDFKDLTNYDTLTVSDYYGTMSRFSRDMAFKKVREDFVYFVPRDVEYTKSTIRYRLNKRRKPIAERPAVVADFFKTYPNGSTAAYCTFMGGDTRTVKVITSTKNGRRLLILKDSFGNALPGYLFHSFEEIHVIDFRYFLRKIKPYVKKNAITDVLFAHNLSHACSPKTAAAYHQLLGK